MESRKKFLLRVSTHDKAVWTVKEDIDLEVTSRSAARRKATQIAEKQTKELEGTPVTFELIELEEGELKK